MKYSYTIRNLLAMLIWPLMLYPQAKTFDVLNVKPGSGNIVYVQWKVWPLADSLYYEVERSIDTVVWSTIAGFSAANASHWYFHVDPEPGNGINYYRIRQVANGITYSRSEVKWVMVSKVHQLYIWPNPANDLLHVRTSFLKGNMEIIDQAGKLILKIEITNYLMDVPIGRLSKGVYFIYVRNDTGLIKEKFVKS